MGLQHEPEDDFQCRTHQNLYFPERENPALSGLGAVVLITLPIEEYGMVSMVTLIFGENL